MKNLKIIDQIKDLIFLTGATRSEALDLSIHDIDPADSSDAIIGIELGPQHLSLFFVTVSFDSSL